ncbi:anti-sigma-K factor RskA [Crossiella equi]|uniref:Regulator of SigK n=1 Tax=Crossiella equi TaxID=130796 RepID=A0ABS5ASI5_9PSEU|nr:anti-sigma factor [Crossiella equi]MBP2479535.1 anti-sigma-K factor RskA [Crossiella equi]
MNTPADVHTMTGAYVLDALSPAERAQFEEHLEVCPTCALELAEFTETGCWLANALAEPPPPALRDRVLAAAARTPQLSRRAAPPAPLPPARSRPGRRPLLLTAAAVLGIAVLGLQSTAPADYLDRQAVALREAHSRGLDATALLSAADARVLSAANPGGGTLSVVHSPSHAAVVLITSGMPGPAPERAYQAWVIGTRGARSAGLLSATAPLVAHGVAPGERIGVTVEPAGGSVQPTSLPLLTADLPPA